MHEDAEFTAFRYSPWPVCAVSRWQRMFRRQRTVPVMAHPRTAITLEQPVVSAEPQMRGRPDPWPAVSEHFAMRVLSLAELMRGHLDRLETDEEDPDVLERLYRVDHAATRVQRLAENLQILTGRRSADLDGQVTTLVDVIRAGMSAIEHYHRVHIGTVVNLAVVDWAADDVGRVMAELLDNATRYSPPTSSVSVSAHLTEQGSVLVRIEDLGIGLEPARLDSINRKLEADFSGLDPVAPTQLGLAVVQRLARAHGMGVRLARRTPAGTTAMVLLPVPLLCEVPTENTPPALSRSLSQELRAGTDVVVRPSPRQPRRVTELPVRPVTQRAGAPQTGDRLPRRVPASIRGSLDSRQTRPPADVEDVVNQQAWHEDLAAFVAGEAAARPGESTRFTQHRPEGLTT